MGRMSCLGWVLVLDGQWKNYLFRCEDGRHIWSSLSMVLGRPVKKSRIRATLGPPVRVWFRSTDTIPWVLVSTMGVVNTMSPYLYHKSMSLPRIYVSTMSPCLYNEPISIQWVHVYTMSLCLYHESISIPCVNVYTMSPSIYHESLSILWVNVNTISPFIFNIQKFTKRANVHI